MNAAWKLILATVVIFGAGVIVGGLLINHILLSHPRSSHHTALVATGTNRPPARSADLLKPRPPELLSQQFVQQLDDVLQLTPPQREAIQKIITTGQEQNHGIWTNCTAQSRQVKSPGASSQAMAQGSWTGAPRPRLRGAGGSEARMSQATFRQCPPPARRRAAIRAGVTSA